MKEKSGREGMTEMTRLLSHHDSPFIDEFVDLDELLKETLPQLEEAVKEIEQQKEGDHISSDEAQEGQKKKRMKKENRKKKMKKGVYSLSLSQRNEFEGDSKKESRCGITGVGVAETYNDIQQPSTPHHTEAALVEAQIRNNKHAKKKRKMGSKDLDTVSPPQRKRSKSGSDLLSRKGSTQVLVGDDSQTIMSSGSQAEVLTPKEIWKQRHLYLAMEACLQRLRFIKDVYMAILYSLKATINHTHN